MWQLEAAPSADPWKFATWVSFFTTKSIFHPLNNISTLQPLLSDSRAETLIHAFITSRRDYCNEVLPRLPSKALDGLQYVQNSAVRLLKRTSPGNVSLEPSFIFTGSQSSPGSTTKSPSSPTNPSVPFPPSIHQTSSILIPGICSTSPTPACKPLETEPSVWPALELTTSEDPQTLRKNP